MVHLTKKHPEYEITVLARTEAQGQKIQAAYPAITYVVGDLDSVALLEEHAATADVVLRTTTLVSSRVSEITLWHMLMIVVL